MKSPPFIQTLARKLLYERTARAMDVEQFAEFIKLSASRIRNLEKGRPCGIPVEDLEPVADALGLPLWELLRPNPHRELEKPRERTVNLTDRAIDLVELAVTNYIRLLEEKLDSADADADPLAAAELRVSIAALNEAKEAFA